jgi:hypothetical protein
MKDARRGTAPRDVQAPARICSGACPFFEPVYDLGRKVAGTGACEKHGGGITVQVGNACLWPKLSRPDSEELAALKASDTRR